MLANQDAAMTTEIFVGDGNPKPVCLTFTRTLNYLIPMLKLQKSYELEALVTTLFSEELANNDVDAGLSTIAMSRTLTLKQCCPKHPKEIARLCQQGAWSSPCLLIYSAYDATHNVVPQDLNARI
jgi:hypothetical protein